MTPPAALSTLHDDDASLGGVTVAQTEAIVADRVEAAVAKMRGELDIANLFRGEMESLTADNAELWRRLTDLEMQD